MEVIIVFLSSLGGALIGTSIGILLMYRKTTIPPTEAERLVLTAKLNSAEVSLAAAVSTGEELQRQVTEKEEAWQATFDELNQKHQQLDFAVAEAQEHEAKRAEAEQVAQDLNAKVTALSEQCAALDARVTQERSLVIEQASQQFVVYENQLAIAKRQNQEMAAESARLGQELAQERTRLSQELAGETTRLNFEVAQLKNAHDQEVQDRSSAEAKLAVEVERNLELTARLTALENERSQFDLKLVQERQSATKGMELLLAAQENLSRVLMPLCADVSNGNGLNGHAPAPAEETAPEEVSSR